MLGLGKKHIIVRLETETRHQTQNITGAVHTASLVAFSCSSDLQVFSLVRQSSV